MKETLIAAMPACFEKWCYRFDDLFNHKAQKREFRHYIAGLLGESERKNLTQMANNAVDVTYHKIHNFLTEAPWSYEQVNERRLKVMGKCSQTRINKGFTLIVDDSGHKKSGNFTAGVGRQYIGQIGKTENGVVMVTTHLYDGTKSLPLDVNLYQHANSLPQGKQDEEFRKKPDLALGLIDKCLQRKYKPGLVLIDSSYGNNSRFVSQMEERKLKYIVGLAKNRTVFRDGELGEKKIKSRLDEVAKSLAVEDFTPILSQGTQEKTVWVATFKGETIGLEGEKVFAIIMNSQTLSEKTEIDYLMTNELAETATPQWFVEKYAQRNWVEVFYREAKGWLGLTEYQVREKHSLYRHWILVFCAYTFILWHQLTGGLRRRWANKELKTFTEALEAFRTAISYRFVRWLQDNAEVFAAYKASLGFIWA